MERDSFPIHDLLLNHLRWSGEHPIWCIGQCVSQDAIWKRDANKWEIPVATHTRRALVRAWHSHVINVLSFIYILSGPKYFSNAKVTIRIDCGLHTSHTQHTQIEFWKLWENLLFSHEMFVIASSSNNFFFDNFFFFRRKKLNRLIMRKNRKINGKVVTNEIEFIFSVFVSHLPPKMLFFSVQIGCK